jgi:Icc-related predicted phosphoesterase
LEAANKVKKVGAELIVICGDITNFGPAEQAQALLSPVAESNLPVLYVPGNCDLPSLLDTKIEGTRNIHESCAKIENLVFIGVGGALSGPLNTPLEFPDHEISAILHRGLAKCSLPERLILVSHIPPFNTKVDLAFNGEHIGSQSVRRFVEEKKPLAVFCGHVHEARGSDNIGDTVILNPGPARHGYCAVACIHNKVEVKLESFE